MEFENIPFSISYETEKVLSMVGLSAKAKGVTINKQELLSQSVRRGDPLRFRLCSFQMWIEEQCA